MSDIRLLFYKKYLLSYLLQLLFYKETYLLYYIYLLHFLLTEKHAY